MDIKIRVSAFANKKGNSIVAFKDITLRLGVAFWVW
jgi:hypothetical protein